MRDMNSILLDCATTLPSGRLVVADWELRRLPEGEQEAVLSVSTDIGTIDRGETAYVEINEEEARRYLAYLYS